MKSFDYHLLILGVGFLGLSVMPGTFFLLIGIMSTIQTFDLVMTLYFISTILIISYCLGFTLIKFKKEKMK